MRHLLPEDLGGAATQQFPSSDDSVGSLEFARSQRVVNASSNLCLDTGFGGKERSHANCSVHNRRARVVRRERARRVVFPVPAQSRRDRRTRSLAVLVGRDHEPRFVGKGFSHNRRISAPSSDARSSADPDG